MLTKALKQLTLADIERLKENGVSESRFIGFKSSALS